MVSPTTTVGQPVPKQKIVLMPLAIADAPRIDGLKLLESREGVLILFSIQNRPALGRVEMILQSVSVAAPARLTTVATIGQLLPALAAWDARIGEDGGIEIVFERAGGALNTLVLQTVGRHRVVSSRHPFQSFNRPHFVRVLQGSHTADVGATVDKRSVGVFPAAAAGTAPFFLPLVAAAEGIVVGVSDRWVAAKMLLSGPVLFETPPGRLVLMRPSSSGFTAMPSVSFVDTIAYEFDAAPVGDEIVVFATGAPALLLRSRNPALPLYLEAPDRECLSALSRPTLAVSGDRLHLAAVAFPATPRAVVVYASVPLNVVTGQQVAL